MEGGRTGRTGGTGKKFWKKIPEEAERRREELEKQLSSSGRTVYALNLETVTGLVLTSGGHEVERISGKSGKREQVVTSVRVLKNMMVNKRHQLKVQEQCDLPKAKAI